MKFLLATHNTKKCQELKRLLKPLGIDVLSGADIGVKLTDAEETGSDFEQNARIKAESGCRESGMPCIADDSGLMTDALGGAPGIFSARFAGEHGDDDKNIMKLLRELEGVPTEKRTARFVSAVCCIFPCGKCINSFGECRGTIAFEKRGNGGFGYDPVFLPEEIADGRTMAELTPEEKDSISHRKRALLCMAALLKEEIYDR
ncbi:MAG: RdgB/HAM1 family non-canonical purine NTP pyrophosphatase [Clostridiales bacterium]|jgi:XTP/dITP diphosphohydrolase|nr:RdgB/HAM1 family non-canonical purine NTP pyrophosphatase [Clostridiales bacterium]